MAKTMTALFTKGGIIAALTLEIGQFGSVRVCRFDPRETPPVSRGPWDFLEPSELAFERSKTASMAGGWELVYEGSPLKG